MLDGYLEGEIKPFSVSSTPEAARASVRGMLRSAFRGRQPAARPRVLIYSHDTFGLGHLRRNLAIAEHLLQRPERFEVWLLTGSPVIHSWTLPIGLHVQPLPPVVKLGAENYAERYGRDPFALVKGYREALIVKLVCQEKPDFLLVDHSPAGMRGELLPALSLIRRELPNTRVVLGLRDILDAPETVTSLWREENTYALLDRAYDDILVYGSRSLFDLVEAYEIPSDVASKLKYVGHIGRKRPLPAEAAGDAWPNAQPGARVLVTAGGGGDGMFMMDAYGKALSMLPEGLTNSLILTGPLMPAEQAALLRARAGKRRDITFMPHTTDLPAIMANADLVVSMGGYNTTVEILAARKKAIIVPRAAPRAEQLMRSRLLHGLGLVWNAEPDADLPQRLAALVPDALAGIRHRQPAWDAIDLDGAKRVGDLLAFCFDTSSRPAEFSQREQQT
jgi:predicted glycosyltransferase